MKLRMILVLVLVLGSVAGAHAAADEAATQWLEKLLTLVDEQALRAEYTVTANGVQQGMAIEVTARGELLQQNEELYTNSIDMAMKSPAMGETAMEVNSRQVSDGTTVWAETYVSAMGITQVGKIALADLRALSDGQSGVSLGQSSLYMGPMSMLEALVDAFDVTVLEIAEGMVSLSMTPTAETAAAMAEEGATGEMSGVLKLREKDAAPVSAHVGMAGGMDVVIEFTSFETIDPADIPAGTFSYVPEPGAQVVDLAPLLKAGM